MLKDFITFIRQSVFAVCASRRMRLRRQNLLPRSHMEVKSYQSRQVVIAINADGHRHKILQILFSKDGSLYVTFPYFTHRNGILAVVTVKGPLGSTSNIDLADSGKVASHLVKYSHHPDGRAHFSQDGKVRTEIKKRSVPLVDQNGHIFTVLVQGLTGFTPLQGSPKDNAQRTTLTFDVVDRSPKAFRIVGRWYWLEDLHVKRRPPVVGPTISTIDTEGNKTNAFIIANPNRGTQHVLVLTCSVEAQITQNNEVLMFYGGFDPPNIVFNPRRTARFLTFLYPAENFEALKARLGSVDFAPPLPGFEPSRDRRKRR
jgi:hypothetical protein